jgi:asparagine synthase (glutamine-hydrolysing)
MCGIAGVVDPTLPREDVLALLRRMVATLVHRGPDDDGFFAEDGAGLGMRRLSIIDVAGGQQPLTSEDGSVQVVCNGEIYNFQELRAALQTKGHVFRSRSDVEVIAHAFEERGSSCVEDLRGMFALAVWDRRRRQLLLARDRLGKKPLFYAFRRGRLLFASEIKALLAADPDLARPDVASLVPYLRFGFVPEPGSAFVDIAKLPAAHELRYEDGQIAVAPYWDVRPDAPGGQPPTRREAVARLDALLEEAVRIRLVSDVPLGIFLSGGLDSSTIVAYAHRTGQRPLKTFTIGFDQPRWDESQDARVVADHFGTEHHVLTLRERDLRESLVETLFTLVRHFDEPFADASALPTYHVSKLAREHVTVILGGDGGDELFAGYSSYRGIRFAEAYQRLPAPLQQLLPPALDRFAERLPPGRRYGTLRAAKVARESLLPFDQLYLSKISLARTPLLRALLAGDLGDRVDGGARWYPPAVASVLGSELPRITRAAYADLRFGLVNDMLVKVDRMSMATSLEVRSPLLDHRLVEYAVGLPEDLHFRRWHGKAILRDVVSPSLPPATLRKPKQGFSVPLREWLRTSLNELVGDYLEAENGALPSGLLDRRTIARLLAEHRRGEIDHSAVIWSLLVYATWYAMYARAPNRER